LYNTNIELFTDKYPKKVTIKMVLLFKKILITNNTPKNSNLIYFQFSSNKFTLIYVRIFLEKDSLFKSNM
jgi:hypothetical protein